MTRRTAGAGPAAGATGRPCRGGEAGLTLVELLVVTAIGSLVLTLITTFAISSTRTIAGTEQRLADVAQAQLGMDVATQLLRTLEPHGDTDMALVPATASNPEWAPAADNVVFYARSDLDLTTDPPEGPRRVRLTVEGDVAAGRGALVAYTVPATTTTAVVGGESVVSYTYDQPAVRRVLARGLVDDAVFTFADSCGPAPTPAPASAFDLADSTTWHTLRCVGIRVEVRSLDHLGVGSTVVDRQVRLANTR